MWLVNENISRGSNNDLGNLTQGSRSQVPFRNTKLTKERGVPSPVSRIPRKGCESKRLLCNFKDQNCFYLDVLRKTGKNLSNLVTVTRNRYFRIRSCNDKHYTATFGERTRKVSWPQFNSDTEENSKKPKVFFTTKNSFWFS